MKLNLSYFICLLIMVVTTGCHNYNWNKHPVMKKNRIAKLIKHLDDKPDMLHFNYTPAVHDLGNMGMEAVEALIPFLGNESEVTRLHAITALADALYCFMKTKLNLLYSGKTCHTMRKK